MSDKNQKLSLYGIGPVYGTIISVLTATAFLCRNLNIFQSGKIEKLKIPFIIAGIIFVLIGIFMWIQAVIVSKIDDGIRENYLVTRGIYAWVRNPIYSAFMMAYTGIVLIIGNVFFFVLPFLYWLLMTVLVRNTEEKWLYNMFGDEYKEYCKKVNRCIPWKK